MAFQKATKKAAKLRMAIAGPSGSGKTYTSLAVACALGERVAVVDTEHGSASKYADRYAFDVLELEAPFHPDRLVEALRDAAAGGYDVVVLDSLSHFWNGSGGLLEIVDQIAARTRNPNTFAAWKDATPIQNRMVEALLSAPVHVIATMRAKQEYVLESDEKGKQRPKKVGMAPIQRDSFEYEFDVFAEMDMENRLIVSKTRCSALAGRVMDKPGTKLADTLRAWLSDGAPNPATERADPTQMQALQLALAGRDVPAAKAAKLQARILAGMTQKEAADALAFVHTFPAVNGKADDPDEAFEAEWEPQEPDGSPDEQGSLV